MCNAENEGIESTFFRWFSHAGSAAVGVNGLLFKAKAIHFAECIKIKSFQCC
jgi:hypothetical protein